MSYHTGIHKMQKIMITLGIAVILSLAGCNSDDDSDPTDGSDPDDNGEMPMASTLDSVISQPANSQPVNDGLDQVNADLLTLFGDANAEPIALDENETVSTFIAKSEAAP